MLNYINHDVQHAMKYVLKETKAKMMMMIYQSENDENSCHSKGERERKKDYN